MLDDIRSVDENGHAANQICEIVRELTRDPHTRLHASAAGGRKTMSIYLTFRHATLRPRPGPAVARAGERAVRDPSRVHTTSRPNRAPCKCETGRGRRAPCQRRRPPFTWRTCPFIRLRGLIPDWMQRRDSDYNGVVRQAQEDLDLLEGDHTFRIHCRSKSLTVSNRRLCLTTLEFFFHALLAVMRQQDRGQSGFVRLDDVTADDLADTFARITQAGGRALDIADHELVAGYSFLGQLQAQLASPHPKDREHLTERFSQIISKSRKRARQAGVPPHYLMTARGRGAARRYGLQVEPERIVWEDDATTAASPKS